MPTIIDRPFSVDELLLIRHLLANAAGWELLGDETLFVLDVESETEAVAIRDSALEKVRALLGRKRPVEGKQP